MLKVVENIIDAPVVLTLSGFIKHSHHIKFLKVVLETQMFTLKIIPL